jgi:hypothetical protein
MIQEETLEEAAERLYPEEWNWNEKEIFIKGAKWQAERMYSEDDILKIINMSRKICSIDGNIDLDNDSLQGNLKGFSMKYTINQMFEQFKKK